MVEQGVRFDVFADILGIPELKFGDHVVNLVQFVRVRIEGSQAIGDFQEIVALFEDARGDEWSYEIFVTVNGFNL